MMQRAASLQLAVQTFQHMARIRYLVSYDICDPKRLRRVARARDGAH